jgi:hypothetical protein
MGLLTMASGGWKQVSTIFKEKNREMICYNQLYLVLYVQRVTIPLEFTIHQQRLVQCMHLDFMHSQQKLIKINVVSDKGSSELNRFCRSRNRLSANHNSVQVETYYKLFIMFHMRP